MSPTNLGALASDQPAPTGLVQRKQGAVDTYLTYNNTVTYGTIHHDGQGGPMQISITPTRRGWWVLGASALFNVPNEAWTSWEWGISLTPADLIGMADDRCQQSQHAAVGWHQTRIDTAYWLEAGQPYTASLVWLYSAGYTQYWHCHPWYNFIEGEFIGEGAA